MEDTRLTQPVKLNTLLVIITLAMAWASFSAMNDQESSYGTLCWNGRVAQGDVDLRGE